MDRVLTWDWIPNRIDPAAAVSSLAHLTASSVHGPVTVGDHARLHRVQLAGPITIGRSSSLWGPGINIYARDCAITFGNFCSVAWNVNVHGYGHDPRRLSTHYIGRNVLGRPIEDEIVSRGPIAIGHDVWIGAAAHIMSGVTVGTGAVIGAGAVVSSSIPPYAIAAGAPARVLRYRFEPAIIERLLASEWWLWTRDRIRASADLFSEPVTPALLDRYLGS